MQQNSLTIQTINKFLRFINFYTTKS